MPYQLQRAWVGVLIALLELAELEGFEDDVVDVELLRLLALAMLELMLETLEEELRLLEELEPPVEPPFSTSASGPNQASAIFSSPLSFGWTPS